MLGSLTWQNNQLLLSSRIFEDMKQNNVTFRELKKFIEDYIMFRNNFFVGAPHNQEVYLQKDGEKFAMGIFFLNKTESSFHLWHNGDESLGTMDIDADTIPSDDFCSWVKERIDEYLSGKIRCSECSTLLYKSEIAGWYFAGRYCKDCWESKWKEIAAKETYD